MKVLIVKEVAALLQVSQQTVYRLANAGAIPAFRVAGAWRFDADAIRAWVGGAGPERERSSRAHARGLFESQGF